MQLHYLIDCIQVLLRVSLYRMLLCLMVKLPNHRTSKHWLGRVWTERLDRNTLDCLVTTTTKTWRPKLGLIDPKENLVIILLFLYNALGFSFTNLFT